MDPFAPINGISLERYAELGADVSDFVNDQEKCAQIVEARGINRADWQAAVAGWTARMQDMSLMGRVAMAYMPLYQAALARKGPVAQASYEDFVTLSAAIKAWGYEGMCQAYRMSQTQWTQVAGFWNDSMAREPMRYMSHHQFVEQEAARLRGGGQLRPVTSIQGNAAPPQPGAQPSPQAAQQQAANQQAAAEAQARVQAALASANAQAGAAYAGVAQNPIAAPFAAPFAQRVGVMQQNMAQQVANAPGAAAQQAQQMQQAQAAQQAQWAAQQAQQAAQQAQQRPPQPQAPQPQAPQPPQPPQPQAQPSGPPPAGGPIAPGTEVLVLWSDNNRYPGTVAQAAPGQYLVAFPDGRQVWVGEAYVGRK
jgi:hypothetical protein